MEEINRFFFGDILLNNFFVTTTYKSEDDNELSNNYDVYDYLSGEPATLEQYIFSNEEREKYTKIYKSIPDFQGHPLFLAPYLAMESKTGNEIIAITNEYQYEPFIYLVKSHFFRDCNKKRYEIERVSGQTAIEGEDDLVARVDNICDNLNETLNTVFMHREENTYVVARRINNLNRLVRKLVKMRDEQ